MTHETILTVTAADGTTITSRVEFVRRPLWQRIVVRVVQWLGFDVYDWVGKEVNDG